MTLKEAIAEALSDWHVEHLKVDKTEEVHGLESVVVTAVVNGRQVAFTYAKKLGMTNEHAAHVLKTHVRSSLG